MDEVQTGCGASGTFWAHEAWHLPSPPDAVTFSKKMQLAGYYCTAALIPDTPYRIFNTWMGDPVRLLQVRFVHCCSPWPTSQTLEHRFSHTHTPHPDALVGS